MSKFTRLRGILFIALAAVLALGSWAALRAWGDGRQEDHIGPTASVQRGSLTVSITEAGELEAERQTVISNELRWPVIIREVVPEGTVVQAGDVIIQFECKELIDAIAKEELELTSAENSYTQASQSLLLKKEEMANSVLKAQRGLEEATENQRRYVEHDYRIEQAEKESAVRVAEQKLALARDKLEFKRKVNDMPDLESPYSENDIRADEVEIQQLENGLTKARLELEKLQKYDHERELRRLADAVSDAELALRRAKLEQSNQILTAEANKEAKHRTLQMHSEKLEELKADEAKLMVRSEKSGLVVYDTNQRRWQTPITIAVGEEIRPRQQLMIIPDMASLQISTKVYESMIDQVQRGLPAYIRLDARPELRLTGKVSKVAPLPDSQDRWMSTGAKVYSTTVNFASDIPAGLKPGMTAQVELILAELDDVLSIPVAAVFARKQQTFCYQVRNGSAQRTPVQVGRMNDQRVEVISGLAKGDKVLLAPPTSSAENEAPIVPTEVAGDEKP